MRPSGSLYGPESSSFQSRSLHHRRHTVDPAIRHAIWPLSSPPLRSIARCPDCVLIVYVPADVAAALVLVVTTQAQRQETTGLAADRRR